MQAVFLKLLPLPDDEVMGILAFAVAETLSCGSELVETAGAHLGTDMAEYWTPDDTFLDLLRDKEAINAMLAEIGGKTVAKGNLTATAKVQKGIIHDFIHGENSRKARPDWQPRYMGFPMQGYTKRQKTIPAVNVGTALKKALKAA